MPVSKYLPETMLQKMAIPVARILAKTRITPNQITVLSFLIFIPPAMYLFAQGTYLYGIIALGLCYASAFFDYVDGQVARLKSISSPLGAWLDYALDWISMNAVLFAIVFGVIHQRPGLPRLMVGLGCLLTLNIHSLISYEFNLKFNFSSYTAPSLLEKLARAKEVTKRDLLIKNILVPRSLLFAPLFTSRYLITFGILFNMMYFALMVLITTLTIKWVLMFYFFLCCLSEKKKGSLIVRLIRELKNDRSK